MKIREYRLQRGYTQKEFARKIGVPASTLCTWENETRTPSVDQLILISDILGVSMDQLLDRSAEKSEDREVLERMKNPDFHSFLCLAMRAKPSAIRAAAAVFRALEEET